MLGQLILLNTIQSFNNLSFLLVHLADLCIIQFVMKKDQKTTVAIPKRTLDIQFHKIIALKHNAALIKFLAPSFSDLTNTSIYESLQKSMLSYFSQNHVPVDSVSLSNPKKNSEYYLVLHLQVFPFGQVHFNRAGIATIRFALRNWF